MQTVERASVQCGDVVTAEIEFCQSFQREKFTRTDLTQIIRCDLQMSEFVEIVAVERLSEVLDGVVRQVEIFQSVQACPDMCGYGTDLIVF